MLKTKLAATAAFIALLTSTSVLAADRNVQALEKRIADLEARLGSGASGSIAPKAHVPATTHRVVKDNGFNPSIGMVLNGQYNQFSADDGDIAGFLFGEESERPSEGFGVDHTELNFSANVDDKFYGSTTFALAEHDGSTEVELEEVFIQTLPGAGLPDGVGLKVGRAFWTLGYLNEHHSHADDFADRPLPYRVFLNGGFNDDGAELTYTLPTDVYAEIGGGLFRGNDTPFGGGSGAGNDGWSAFARIGGDIDANQSWRVGGYMLSGSSTEGDHGHGGGGDGHTHDAQGNVVPAPHSHEDAGFYGDTDIVAFDVRYTLAPTGNPSSEELILQAEYFTNDQDGEYEIGNHADDVDDSSDGWYAQAVYKFDPQWRIGARYSQLSPIDAPTGLVGTELDSEGHDPEAYSAMLDWTNSEFSRVRLQYNHEELTAGQNDDQLMLQYIMSIGAHGAHKY